MELTINPEEPAFEYTWCRPRKTPNAHIKVVGTLHCSVSSTRASDEPLKSTALQTEHLRILSASHLKSKKIIEDGQAFHCESFCGYIESTSGRYPEINLAFRPPDHDGPYEGAWTNDDDGDELVARLYVDGSVEANEEICKLRLSK